jgi:hypothetical protein
MVVSGSRIYAAPEPTSKAMCRTQVIIVPSLEIRHIYYIFVTEFEKRVLLKFLTFCYYNERNGMVLE